VVHLLPGDIFNVFLVFLVKSTQHLSEKTVFGFPVSPGSAEALVRLGPDPHAKGQ